MRELVSISRYFEISNEAILPFDGYKKYFSTGAFDNGDFDLVTFDSKPARANLQLRAGQLTLAKMKSTSKISLVTKEMEENIYSTGFFALTPKNIETKYLFYLLQSVEFQGEKDAASNGTTQFSINEAGLKRIKVHMVADRKSQKKISLFLDSKVATIDKLIASQEQQINALLELKPIVASDIIGDAHNRMPLKYMGEFQNGFNFEPSSNGSEIRFLGVGDFQNNYQLCGENSFSTIITNSKIVPTSLLKDGDIVFVRSNGSKELVGRAVLVKDVTFPLVYSGFCIRFRNTRRDSVSDEYLNFFFQGKDFKDQLSRKSFGTNINNVTQDKLSSILVPMYPIELQRAKVRKITATFSKIDQIISNKKEKIEALLEYKNALIYEYTSGDKEVVANA